MTRHRRIGQLSPNVSDQARRGEIDSAQLGLSTGIDAKFRLHKIQDTI